MTDAGIREDDVGVIPAKAEIIFAGGASIVVDAGIGNAALVCKAITKFFRSPCIQNRQPGLNSNEATDEWS